MFKDGSSRIAEYRPTMREVKISLTGWKLADAMGELRKWLDQARLLEEADKHAQLAEEELELLNTAAR